MGRFPSQERESARKRAQIPAKRSKERQGDLVSNSKQERELEDP
uniref:Uncharacterized protein n=1 Tax=Arundo donax TaxID=35708 RepID=A0A0A9HQH3_ARUDO